LCKGNFNSFAVRYTCQSHDSRQSQAIATNTWTYWNSGLSFGTHGSTQEILFNDEGTGAQRYRVSIIIGSSYNNNMI
jgi:hypothetical protein